MKTNVKMAESIQELLSAGKLACKQATYWSFAEDCARQALKGAIQELTKSTNERPLDKQSLASWFGDCAFIFHKIGKIEDAIRCYYRARVFDQGLAEVEHRMFADQLLKSILHAKPKLLLLALEESPSLWTDLEEITQLAEEQMRWEVCFTIINEIKGHFTFWGPQVGILSLADVPVMHPLVRRAARCAFHMNKPDILKEICTAIQERFSKKNDVEAYEIEARANYQEGHFEQALAGVNQALRYCKNDVATTTKLILLRLLIRLEEYANDTTASHEPNTLSPEGTPAFVTDIGMSQSIRELLLTGKNVCDITANWHLADYFGRQALDRANQELERYRTGDGPPVEVQSLASWFADCGFIFQQIGQTESAIRCLYKAAVFDWNGVHAEHHQTADELFKGLLKAKPGLLRLALERSQSLWTDLEQITRLAEELTRWEVCFTIINVIKGHLATSGPKEEILYLADVPIMHTLIRRAARCAFHMNDIEILKNVCAAIQDKFSDNNDVEAYEIEARAYHREKNFELAWRDVEQALLYCKDETTKKRLTELHLLIQTELQVHASSKSPKDTNATWLEGTAAFATDRAASPKVVSAKKKKKKKHKRTKGRSSAPEIGRDEALREATRKETDCYTSQYAHSDNSGIDDKTRKGTVVGQVVDVSEKTVYKKCRTNDIINEEDCTFYDKSARLYMSEDCEEAIENESITENLLQFGLQLSMIYVSRFEDRRSDIRQSELFYKNLLPAGTLKKMLAKEPCRYKRCIIRIEAPHLAHCYPIDSSETASVIEISGRSKAGQTYDEDEVVVEISDKFQEPNEKKHGTVIGILERKRHSDIKHPVFICTMDNKESNLVRPMCKTIPKIHIFDKHVKERFLKTKQFKLEIYNYDEVSETLKFERIIDVTPANREKRIFLVALVHWSPRHVYPLGAVIKVLPFGETAESGLTVLNLQNNIHSLYKKDTVEEIELICNRLSDEPCYSKLKGRKDLTSLETFTIDPKGCNVIDDAISIEEGEGGTYKVGVHIADVTAWFSKDEPIDIEAKERATTYYPRISKPRHMLPEPLSSGLCSLQEKKMRLTISIIFYLDSEGRNIYRNGQNYEIYKSYIVSRKQFTYEQVQKIIDGTTNNDDFASNILRLSMLSKKIRWMRLGNAMFAVDAEEIYAFDESEVNCEEAHYLVEEFMIMANTKIASLLKEHFPEQVPLRCQQPPSKENMDEFFKRHGFFIDIMVSLQDKKLNGPVTRVDNILSKKDDAGQNVVYVTKDSWGIITGRDMKKCSRCIRSDDLHPVQHVIRQRWISIQETALYKCLPRRSDRDSEIRHYSLGQANYTHFTSPIRRFIDVVVHRMVHALVDREKCPYTRSEVENICHHVNSRMKRSRAYEKGCNALKQAIESQKKQVFACIDDISDHGLTLSSNEILYVAKQHKELQFNLLNVSTKPCIDKDAVTNKTHVILTWNRRLYDINLSTDSPDMGIVHVLNPRRGVFRLPLTQWAKLLRCALSAPEADLQRAIQQTGVSVGGSGRDDISTECNDPWQISPSTRFSLKAESGNVILVQMSSTPIRGVLAPKPTLFNLSNNVKFCLSHMEDPVRYLSSYSTNPTCIEYNSLSYYIQRWNPLVTMQAAVAAVRNEECFVINNVPITFTGPRHGKFALFSSYCAIRYIDFSGTQYFDEEGEDEDMPLSYDWLCIKQIVIEKAYMNPTSVTGSKSNVVNVFHAEVKQVMKKKSKSGKDGKVVIMFELHEDSCNIPDNARSGDSSNYSYKYSVEVLKKTETDRRTESILRSLETTASALATAIALNNRTFPVIDRRQIILTAREVDRLFETKLSKEYQRLPKNNEEQDKAINQAARSCFTLIQGPPGTGKTFTGIKVIFLFCQMNQESHRTGDKKKHVLFCGPSNKSVDMVAKYMIRRLGNLCPKFVRVYGRSIETLDFPIPGRTYTSKKGKDLKVEDKLQGVALHHVIRQNGKPFAEELNSYDRKFKEKEYNLDSEEMFKEINHYVKLIREASLAEIKENDVILCTTAVASNPKVTDGAHIEQIIIDEAGMCTEPECLVPIVATKAVQVVLIGDHKQLRPIVTCHHAAQLGLETSLFERYANLTSSGYPRNAEFTSLKWQYRMHPQICAFPSHTFYDDNLKTGYLGWKADTKIGDVLLDIWPFDVWGIYPHVLVHVEGEEQILTVSTDEGNEMSRSNAAEVEQVVKIFRYMIEHNVGADRIRIISQYNAQCAEIRRALIAEKLTNFVVSTVVSSQGEEADYVIFSTVRSIPKYKIEHNPTQGWCKFNLGFITDRNQVNVALTRARKGLVIIGNKKLLRCDEVWKKLISHYNDRNCVKTPDEFPPPRKPRYQMMEDNQLRSEIRYRSTIFMRGEATSYEGDFDAVEPEPQQSRGRGRRGRGRARMRFNQERPQESNVAYASDSDS